MTDGVPNRSDAKIAKMAKRHRELRGEQLSGGDAVNVISRLCVFHIENNSLKMSLQDKTADEVELEAVHVAMREMGIVEKKWDTVSAVTYIVLDRTDNELGSKQVIFSFSEAAEQKILKSAIDCESLNEIRKIKNIRLPNRGDEPPSSGGRGR